MAGSFCAAADDDSAFEERWIQIGIVVGAVHDCPVVGLLSTHGETDDCFEALHAEMAREKDILGIDVILGSGDIFSSGLAIISQTLFPFSFSFFPAFSYKGRKQMLGRSDRKEEG